MLLAQPYFCHESLGHRIKLKYSTNFKHFTGHLFKINEKFEKAPYDVSKHENGIYNLEEVEKLVKADLGTADLYVLLGYDPDDFGPESPPSNFLGGTTGIASTGVVCLTHSGYTEDKWSMNEWSKDGPVGMAAVSNVNVKWVVEFSLYSYLILSFDI